MVTATSDTFNTVKAKTVVKRFADDCYALWRDLEDLEDYIPWFEEVIVPIGQENRVKTFSCVLKIAGVESICKLRLTQDEPRKRISWETLDGSPLYHRGSVEFHQLDHGEGTAVTLTLQHQLPIQASETERDNAAGAALARFKEFAETNPHELVW